MSNSCACVCVCVNERESERETRILLHSSSSIAHFLFQRRNKGVIKNTELRLARHLLLVSGMTPSDYSVSPIAPSEF